ncbi:MAG: glycosyltransferase, partial [Ignavibacteria bacterium]|nr:glycosyltransferase [Ignavibacteria bacterium]
MKVSIITVCYNAEKHIEETIQSVLSQDFNDLEYLLIDGGSNDSTVEIVNKYNSKIDCIISEKDEGMYDAMNKGIKLAKGELIGILNAGDLFLNEKVVSEIVNKIEEKDAVYADLDYVNELTTNRIIRKWTSGEFNFTNFKYGWMLPHPTLFIKKKIYENFGMYRLDYKTAADYELMLRIFYKNECSAVYLNRVIVKMRVGGASNSSIKNRINANMEDRKAWKDNELKPYW